MADSYAERIAPFTEGAKLTSQDLDAAITAARAELERLEQLRHARDHADLSLAIFQTTDTWFTAKELVALAPLVPALAARLAGTSAKSLGRRLRAIADAQDRAGTIPPLRLIRLERSTGGALWKIEMAPPSSHTNGTG